MTGRPTLVSLSLADPPDTWRALGFAVSDDRVCRLGGVALRLGGPGTGITGWAVSGVASAAIGFDHVVVVTPDFDRTAQALGGAGLEFRRVRDAGGFRQGFRRLGPAILEVVEVRGEPPDGPARFWGLVVIASDLEALAARLGDSLHAPKDAVQPGRRIATVSRSAGLSTALAFITPEPA